MKSCTITREKIRALRTRSGGSLRGIGVTLLLLSFVMVAGCGGGAGSSGGSDPPTGPAPNPSPTSTVTITPASETLRTGGQRRFSGWDASVGQYDVTWSLQEGPAAGTITADGLYTASNTPGTFHVIATSSHNTSLSATAVVRIVSVGFVPVSAMAARSGHTATLLTDGNVLVAGGTLNSMSAELFIPASSSFVVTNGNMVHARSGHSAGLLPDGRVLIVGGGDASANLFKTAELFDPVHQATRLDNGQVLISHGVSGYQELCCRPKPYIVTLDSAELYQ